MNDPVTLTPPGRPATRPAEIIAACQQQGLDVIRSYIWPLFPKSQIVSEGPMILSHGDGSRVTDITGKTYLDLSGSIARPSALGYGVETVAAAVHDQLRRLHYAGQGDFQADVVFRLAAKLREITPGTLGATYFSESGSSANEVAIKLARLYHRAAGRKPHAYKVISRWDAYHGAVGNPLAASDWLGVRLPSEPGVNGVSHIPAPFGYRSQLGPTYEASATLPLDYLEQQILHEGPELVAAFIAEPVMQGCGVQVPPPDYFPKVREICTRYDVVFIADEVITGFGRTGEWFAMNHWNVEPDIMTMAKAMTAGYVPLGATTVRQEIWDTLDVFPHVNTYGGHPAGAAAALAVIDLYEREGLIAQARDTGKHMLNALAALGSHPIVGDVRGLGMWAAIDFTSEKSSRTSLSREVVRKILLRARELGVIVGMNGSALELAPPLNVSTEDLAEGIGVLDQAIAEVGEV